MRHFNFQFSIVIRRLGNFCFCSSSRRCQAPSGSRMSAFVPRRRRRPWARLRPTLISTFSLRDNDRVCCWLHAPARPPASSCCSPLERLVGYCCFCFCVALLLIVRTLAILLFAYVHYFVVDGRGHSRMTALHWAARQGSAGCVQVLLANGACPWKQTKDGFLPVHWGAMNGRDECVRLLLAHVDRATDSVHGGLKVIHLEFSF